MHRGVRVGLCCGALGLSLAAFHACKTADKKHGEVPLEVAQVGGVFNANNELRMEVPPDINGLTPPAGTQTQTDLKPTISGLNLADGFGLAEEGMPQTTAGIETIAIKCFTSDSLFIAKDWYFYAQIDANGVTQKTFNAQKVDQCNEIQLALGRLDKNTDYVVKAAFFWMNPASNDKIVWYQGETERFKPSDQDKPLTLKKLRVDQNINIDVEKSEKDQCLLKRFLWDGTRCLNTFSAISFVYSDYSDYAQTGSETESRNRKCIQLAGDGGTAIQFDCNSSSKQRVRPVLHGTQVLDQGSTPSSYQWFTIKTDNDKKCLAVTAGPSAGQAGEASYLTSEACIDDTPPARQLFALIAAPVASKGGRNAFRIMTALNNKPMCVSMPPEKIDVPQVAPIRNGAPVRLTSCDTTTEPVRTSQFIRFIDPTL